MTEPENLTNILTSLLDELRTGGNEREWIECKVIQISYWSFKSFTWFVLR